MNTLIIIEAVLIIKGETTVQLRISAVLLRKAGRWDVPYAIQVFPEDEQKENFVVNGRHYYWMSISDMERDPNIVKKNLDVIDFVKESMHA